MLRRNYRYNKKYLALLLITSSAIAGGFFSGQLGLHLFTKDQGRRRFISEYQELVEAARDPTQEGLHQGHMIVLTDKGQKQGLTSFEWIEMA